MYLFCYASRQERKAAALSTAGDSKKPVSSLAPANPTFNGDSEDEHMELKEFTVHDHLGPVTVTGELLAEMRFGQDVKPRWTDMALYRITDTMGDRLVMVRCGCSPARSLPVDSAALVEAPLICGRCHKAFKPAARQKEEPFQYALEVVARSVIYHQIPGQCIKPRHRIISVADVYESPFRWESLTPCRKCRPRDLRDMADHEKIAEEREESTIYLCSNASSVITRLYRRGGDISDLAAKLLWAAAETDPGIKAAIRQPRRI